MKEKPRYVQQIKRGGRMRWRYNPPQDAVDADIVPRTYLSDRKETAFNEAERFNRTLDDWRDGQMQQHHDSRDPVTVNELIQSYQKSLDYQKLKDETKKIYTYQLGLICLIEVKGKLLGLYKINQLTQPMCQQVYESLCKRGIPFANRVLAAVRKVYSWGAKFGHVERNPWKDMDTYAEESRKVCWTPDHVSTYLGTAYSDFGTRSLGLIVHMAYEWAQRVGDMRELTWESIDLASGTLTMTQSKRRALVKIPISDDLLEVLRQQYDDFGWQKYVAPNIHAKEANGFKPYTVYSLSHAARRLIKKAGLPDELRISDLRRTATTEMVEAGVGMAQIMSVTGHANPQSVKPYMKNTLTSATHACTLRSAHRQEVHSHD